MKKKLLSILLIGVLVIGLTGCGKSDKAKMINYLEDNGFKNEDGIYIAKIEDITYTFDLTYDEYEFWFLKAIYNDGSYLLKSRQGGWFYNLSNERANSLFIPNTNKLPFDCNNKENENYRFDYDICVDAELNIKKSIAFFENVYKEIGKEIYFEER